MPDANGSPATVKPFEDVTLEEAIVRGEMTITAVKVMRPHPAQLTGLSLRDLVDMDVASMLRALPRVTEPSLSIEEVGVMNPYDFTALSAELSGFLLPKAVRPASQPL